MQPGQDLGELVGQFLALGGTLDAGKVGLAGDPFEEHLAAVGVDGDDLRHRHGRGLQRPVDLRLSADGVDRSRHRSVPHLSPQEQLRRTAVGVEVNGPRFATLTTDHPVALLVGGPRRTPPPSA